MARRIFVDPPVEDLERAKAFVTSLGFAFNPQFTDDKAACLVIVFRMDRDAPAPQA